MALALRPPIQALRDSPLAMGSAGDDRHNDRRDVLNVTLIWHRGFQ